MIRTTTNFWLLTMTTCDEEVAIEGFKNGRGRDVNGSLKEIRQGEEGVCLSGHSTTMRHPEKRKDELGAVGEKDHDDLTLSHAQSVEANRHFLGGGVDVGVGVDFSSGGIDPTRA
ncbi:hypothetical protein LR48_Vigan07g163000 [Vigna angularis]|uniref:Uncharacterized protein n=2 Tax=Phaseolus angularis TaxID=3914 RepID=A0A0L9UZ01_PHAAN|nr:hypothetical protein LR48_Vigan07g163000 [Vigna angularis]